MGKTLVKNIVSKIKRRADYLIDDDDLSDLILDILDDSHKVVKQLFLDYNILQEVSANASFKTVALQAFRDITKAVIVGDVASFTAVTGDKITVSIDGVDYTTGALTGAVLVATVVTAINLATAAVGDVASEDENGFLQITSLKTGLVSVVTISDDSGTGMTRLFTVAAERTQSAITDLDEIIVLSERTNDRRIEMIPYSDLIEIFPDPALNTSSTPDMAARWLDRIYFGPTPSQAIFIYIDYIKALTALTLTSTMPFSEKYDGLLIAMVKEEIYEFLDNTNAVGLTLAQNRVKRLKDELIIGRAKNVGMNQQTKSRDFSDSRASGPRMVK